MDSEPMLWWAGVLYFCTLYCCVQFTEYRQSAKLFLQSSELGLPQPLTRRRVCPPPLWTGRMGHTMEEDGATIRPKSFWLGRVCDLVYVMVAIPWKSLLPSGKHLRDAGWAESPYSFCPGHRPRIPSPPPLCVAKTGRNNLNEEFTPLLLTG